MPALDPEVLAVYRYQGRPNGILLCIKRTWNFMKLLPTLGLLSLALAGIASASTVTFDSRPFPVDSGGQFGAHLNSDAANSLTIYCVDFSNHVSLGSTYSLAISAPDPSHDPSSISGANFGGAAQGSFTLQNAPSTDTFGDALDRYLEAAWLITQYDLGAGANTGSKDVGIQNAIWNILDTGATHANGDYTTWENNAANWLKTVGGSGLANFAQTVLIYTPSSGGTPAQEMIGFTSSAPPASIAPEPTSAALVAIGIALAGLGQLRKRKS